MAVFPYSRRALWRPARLAWLIAATTLIVLSSGLLDASLIDGRATSIRASDASPAFKPADSGRMETTEAPASTSQLTTDKWYAPVTMATEVRLAAEAAWSQTIRPVARLVEAPELKAEIVEAATITELVAEVSEVAAVSEAVEVDTPAGISPNAAPATEAPPSETQPATAASPPQVAPAPALPALVAPSGPVERWAAAGVVIVTDGQSLDDASLANVDAALSVLPVSVLSNLGNPALGPLYILVNTEGRVRSGDQPYGGAANFFSTNEATNELVLYPNQSVFTIVHELGHAYNLRRTGAGRYAMVLLDPEMRSFLTASGWQITSSEEEIRTAVDHMHVNYTYAGSFHWPRMSNDDPLEDFANSFSMFFLDPGTLQQQSPERYAWMAGNFGN